jgi:hypothetical protein
MTGLQEVEKFACPVDVVMRRTISCTGSVEEGVTIGNCKTVQLRTCTKHTIDMFATLRNSHLKRKS